MNFRCGAVAYKVNGKRCRQIDCKCSGCHSLCKIQIVVFVHIKPQSLCLKIYPLRRPFSKSCVFRWDNCPLGVDKEPTWRQWIWNGASFAHVQTAFGLVWVLQTAVQCFGFRPLNVFICYSNWALCGGFLKRTVTRFVDDLGLLAIPVLSCFQGSPRTMQCEPLTVMECCTSLCADEMMQTETKI